MSTVICGSCFRACALSEGQRGFCGARACENGEIRCVNYGLVTSIALDPIEKKPLRRFYPGSKILSVGSFGCNMLCPICQNEEISRPSAAKELALLCRRVTPEELADAAVKYTELGNIGLAFTYNEPLVGWEFVLDAARLSKKAGLKNVLVTNGTASPEVLERILPYIDAMNIDLKSFSTEVYSGTLRGSLEAVKEFTARAVKACHAELTTLIVPGMNDTPEEMDALAAWVSQLRDGDGCTTGENIPLHVTRFFPRAQMSGAEPTPVATVYALADRARRRLRYVYTGNC